MKTISFDVSVYATGTLLISIFHSESIVLRTSLDQIADNILYVETLLTIKTVEEFKCTYFCDRLTKNKRNLRKYTEESETCEYFFASDFCADSRDISKKMDNSILLLTVSGFACCTRSFDGRQSYFKIYLFKTLFEVSRDISECFLTEKKTGERVKVR